MNDDFDENIYDFLLKALESVQQPLTGKYYEYFRENSYPAVNVKLEGVEFEKYKGFISVFAALVRLLSDIAYEKNYPFKDQIDFGYSRLELAVNKLKLVSFNDAEELEDLMNVFIEAFDRNLITGLIEDKIKLVKSEQKNARSREIDLYNDLNIRLSLNALTKEYKPKEVSQIFDKAKNILMGIMS